MIFFLESKMQIILSVLSDDKPGVVRTIANIVAHHGGNWLDCRLSRLGGKFAGVICIEIAAQERVQLELSLGKLSEQGLRVIVDDISANEDALGIKAIFSAAAADRKGLVLELSQALAAAGINVLELATERTSMPYSGDPLFCAEGLLMLPVGLSIEDASDSLERITSDLGIDFTIESNPD
jgi:glycine cleavage system regulatory protein